MLNRWVWHFNYLCSVPDLDSKPSEWNDVKPIGPMRIVEGNCHEHISHSIMIFQQSSQLGRSKTHSLKGETKDYNRGTGGSGPLALNQVLHLIRLSA